jgi:uncharacterized protein
VYATPIGILPAMAMDSGSALALLDWKRSVFNLYHRVRESLDPESAWSDWRGVRDDLFRNHPQSPLPQAIRESFTGLDYYDYNPAARAVGKLVSAEPETYNIATSSDSSYEFTRLGSVAFDLQGRHLSLEVYWLEGYGGGLFLPFRDATSGRTTYGAGRYLLDTIKGADLGTEDDSLVLDFNFAYNPSCAYDPRWVCPLAPPPNRLDVPVEAGERWATETGG